MAEHEVVAFRWSGTGYNATYNNSYTAVISDDDDSYEGGGDSGERVSIDGGAPLQTHGEPYSIDVSFTDVSGDSHVETFYFFNAGGDWYFVPSPDSAFSEGARLGSYQSHTVGWDYDAVVCFADGTNIKTSAGEQRVEDLVPGVEILTLDRGYRPLRLAFERKLSARQLLANPKLCPVKIERGALGPGIPSADLWVSRQHRMLIRSQVAERMFGSTEVLVPAIQLTALPGCFVDYAKRSVSYYHLVFDRHEILFSNGAPSESFFPGKEAMKSLPPAQVAEFRSLFPLGQLDYARPVAKGCKQRQLVRRHILNEKAMVSCRKDHLEHPASISRS